MFTSNLSEIASHLAVLASTSFPSSIAIDTGIIDK